jgi:hypothetical protein
VTADAGGTSPLDGTRGARPEEASRSGADRRRRRDAGPRPSRREAPAPEDARPPQRPGRLDVIA